MGTAGCVPHVGAAGIMSLQQRGRRREQSAEHELQPMPVGWRETGVKATGVKRRGTGKKPCCHCCSARCCCYVGVALLALAALAAAPLLVGAVRLAGELAELNAPLAPAAAAPQPAFLVYLTGHLRSFEWVAPMNARSFARFQGEGAPDYRVYMLPEPVLILASWPGVGQRVTEEQVARTKSLLKEHQESFLL